MMYSVGFIPNRKLFTLADIDLCTSKLLGSTLFSFTFLALREF